MTADRTTVPLMMLPVWARARPGCSLPGQAHVGLKSGSAEMVAQWTGSRQRAHAPPGARGRCWNRRACRPGLGGVGEHAVGGRRLGGQPGRPRPALLAVARRRSGGTG